MALTSDLPSPFVIPPIHFGTRSPYSFNNLVGVAPAPLDLTAEVDEADDGTLSVAGVTLQPINATATPGTTPTATVNAGAYGDAQFVTANFTGIGLPVDAKGNPIQFILPRPNLTRLALLIQNNTLGTLYYAWEQTASNVGCISIPAGGNRSFDTVCPQGNLSLYATSAGTAVIEYINNNVSAS